MAEKELELLISRFKEGKTTAEEDLQIVTALNASMELLKSFLNEIKVAKARQDLEITK